MVCNKINVLGWYNHKNCGDESYKLTIPQFLDANQFVFTDTIQEKTPTTILGGGDVLSPHFFDQLKNGDNNIGLSVCINEDNTKEQLSKFKELYVRDKFSLQMANKLGVDAHYIPDLAFDLAFNVEEGNRYLENSFKDSNLELYTKKIAIVINSNLMSFHDTVTKVSNNFENFCYQMAEVIDFTNASFVFIPFGIGIPTDDRLSNGQVATKCKYWKKNLLIMEEITVQDTINIISACDFVISTRLHSSIFSCVTSTPFVDIIHNHKNRNFTDDIQYTLTNNYWNFNKDKLISDLNTNEEEIVKIKEYIQKKTIEKKNRINVFKKKICIV